jgi:hypothetical protein
MSFVWDGEVPPLGFSQPAGCLPSGKPLATTPGEPSRLHRFRPQARGRHCHETTTATAPAPDLYPGMLPMKTILEKRALPRSSDSEPGEPPSTSQAQSSRHKHKASFPKQQAAQVRSLSLSSSLLTKGRGRAKCGQHHHVPDHKDEDAISQRPATPPHRLTIPTPHTSPSRFPPTIRRSNRPTEYA